MKRFVFSCSVMFLLLLLGCSSAETGSHSSTPEWLEALNELTFDPGEGKPRLFSEADASWVGTGTAFVTDLEGPVSSKGNLLFTAALGAAWTQVEKALGSGIRNPGSLPPRLKALALSGTASKIQLPSDSRVNVETGDGIQVWVSYSQAMQYRHSLDPLKTPIMFSDTAVESFGLEGDFDPLPATTVGILYYESDDRFAIRLNTDAHDYELVLVKGIAVKGKMLKAFQKAESWIQKGNQEREEEKNRWKYLLVKDMDTLRIPVLNFNLRDSCKDMTGARFYTADNKPHYLHTMQNWLALSMDDQGLSYQAFGSAAVDSLAEYNTPHPKRLVFDSPYFLYVRNKKDPYPSMMLVIRNSDLMVKAR